MDRSDVKSLLKMGSAQRIDAVETSEPEHWGGVLRTRVVIRASDGHEVPCLLLEPEEPSDLPPAVAIHQHNGEFHLGKSEPAGMAGNPEQAYGLALARAGITTIIPDLPGFEERRDPDGDGAHDERFHAWNLVACGKTLLGAHVGDVALATDWILEHTGASVCGVIGHSLGGQVGFFSMACDERLVTGVLNCGIGTVASFEPAGVLHNPSWYPPDIIAVGDTPAIATAFEGQRVLVRAGRDDELFPLSGVDEAVSAFGPGIADYDVIEAGHVFPTDRLASSVEWLVRELGGWQ